MPDLNPTTLANVRARFKRALKDPNLEWDLDDLCRVWGPALVDEVERLTAALAAREEGGKSPASTPETSCR
jgi:hypothetical protein